MPAASGHRHPAHHPPPYKEVHVSRKLLTLAAFALCFAVPALAASPAKDAKMAGPAWSMNATIIGACSCPMFCQCYFSTKPASHAKMSGHEGHAHAGHDMGGESEHFCRANNAYRVNKGMYGSTKLDGARFWIAMDLGDDFSDGEMKWAILTFDPAVTKEQREGIKVAMSHLYPVKW